MATIRGPKIVTSGLVLALDAADKKSYPGSGTAWNDLSGNNNNFTLYNGGVFANNFGGEFQFDGTNDYARNRNNTVINNIAANGTVEFWIRSYGGSFGATSYGRLISISNEANTGSDSSSVTGTNIDFSNFFCFAQNNGTQYYSLWYKNSPGGFGASTLINTDKYNQLIMNWSTSGANMTFNHYLNGVSVASQTFAQTAYSGASTITLGMNAVGALNSAYEPTKVAYAILRFYSRSLSASEVLQNFNTQRRRFGI